MYIEYVHFKEGKRRLSKGEEMLAAKSLNCHEISERDSGIKRCRRQMSDA